MARSKSLTDIAILSLLGIKPMYGVEMVEEIKRLSGNVVIMPLPTLYSSLHKLATKKFVNSYWQEAEVGGRRHVYNITGAGQEYYKENKFDINYESLKTEAIRQEKENPGQEHKTYSTLEEAFSLPLNNKLELPNEKRVLHISEKPGVAVQDFFTQVEPIKQLEPNLRNEVKNLNVLPELKQYEKTTEKKIGTTPYLIPTDKITSSDKPKQMSINLTGTSGSTDLRPFINLNSVQAGNDFVIINKLRVFAGMFNTLIFIIINFVLTLTPFSQPAYYNLIFIALIIYYAIVISIYIVFPKTKSMFSKKNSIKIRGLISAFFLALVITVSIFNKSLELLLLALFAFVPLIEGVFMILLCKGKKFLC